MRALCVHRFIDLIYLGVHQNFSPSFLLRKFLNGHPWLYTRISLRMKFEPFLHLTLKLIASLILYIVTRVSLSSLLDILITSIPWICILRNTFFQRRRLWNFWFFSLRSLGKFTCSVLVLSTSLMLVKVSLKLFDVLALCILLALHSSCRLLPPSGPASSNSGTYCLLHYDQESNKSTMVPSLAYFLA